MPAAVLAATRRAGRDLGRPALSQATCLGPAKRRGLLRALEPKSCQRIARFMVLGAPRARCLFIRLRRSGLLRGPPARPRSDRRDIQRRDATDDLEYLQMRLAADFDDRVF